MKKIISTISFMGMLVMASTAFAVVSKGVDGNLDISDAGAGPGIDGIAISGKSFVTYSGLDTAGGYTGCGAGDVMAVVSASSAADPEIALYFAVRDSNTPDCDPDNKVYQKSAEGTAPTADLVTTEVAKDFEAATNKYAVRGAGSAAAAATDNGDG